MTGLHSLRRFVPERRMEALAHVSSWVAVTLTAIMVDQGPLTESNPVAEALMGQLGMLGFALLTPVMISVLYRLVERYGDHHFYWALPAGLLTADAIANIVATLKFGLPNSLAGARIVLLAGAVLALAAICYLRLDRCAASRIRSVSNQRVGASLAALLIVTSLLTPIPMGIFGAATAATPDAVRETFEDGTNDGWSTGTVISESVNGDYSLQVDDGEASWESGPSLSTTDEYYITGTARAESGINSFAVGVFSHKADNGVKLLYDPANNQYGLAENEEGGTGETYTTFGSYSANEWTHFNMSFEGSSVRVKTWPASQDEPDAFDASIALSYPSQTHYLAAGPGSGAGGDLDDIAVNTDSTGLSDRHVGGRLLTQDGEPVPNGTVRAVAVNETRVEELYADTEKAISETDSLLSDPFPERYHDYISNLTDGNLAGAGPEEWDSWATDHVSGKYVTAHTSSAWDAPFLSQVQELGDDPDLSSPRVNVPADEEVTLTIWDSTNSGLYQDSVDGDLPGATTSGEVHVRGVGPGGSYTGRNFTVETEEVGSTALKTHETATLKLSQGLWELQPADGGARTYITAGGEHSVSAAFTSRLRDEKNNLLQRSAEIQDAIENGTLVPETVETNETGHFGFEPAPGVSEVRLMGYKAPDEMNADPSNVTAADVLTWYESANYNGSVYVSDGVETVAVGQNSQDVTVETVEVSAPPLANLSRVNEAWDWFQDYLDDHTYAEAVSALQQRLEDVDDEELREHYIEMYEMAQQNAEIVDENVDLLNATEAQNATISELRNQTNLLEEELAEVENSIETGDGASEIADQLLSASQEFDTPLSSENVQVLVHYANGTSETVPTDSEYVSIESNAIGGDTVALEDYPIGDAAAATAHFRVVTEDGMGEWRGNARNPAFGGDIPGLEAIDLTTLQPGPDENVRVTAYPEEVSGFGSLEAVEVHGPDGSAIQSTPVDSDASRFTTAGEGEHHVSVTYSNVDGHNFTTTFRVLAANENRDMPAGIRVKQSPVGTYALTGDKFAGGQADVSNGGATVDVAGRVRSDNEIPGEVHVHTHGVSMAPHSETHVSLLRGEDDQTVSKNVRVVMHTPELSADALVYRHRRSGLIFDRSAITSDGSQYGVVTKRDSNATIRSYTHDDGRVTLETIESPGYIDRALHRVNVAVQGIPGLPSSGLGMVAPARIGPAAAGPAVHP